MTTSASHRDDRTNVSASEVKSWVESLNDLCLGEESQLAVIVRIQEVV